MAEAIVALAAIASIERAGSGLNLQVRGAPHGSALVESAGAVTGPWNEVSRLRLDASGRATLTVEENAGDSARFFRVIIE